MNYKEILYHEYHDTYDRFVSLHTIISNIENKVRTYYRCETPLIILKQQFQVMKEYLEILETRAEFEGVDLFDNTKNIV